MSLAPPKISLPASAPVVRVLPGYTMKWSAIGSPPIYTALMKNSTVLANTTGSMEITLTKEANYTCVANSKYGVDVRRLSVVMSGN